MRKYNHDIAPGRTIVVGTEQGLHARVRALGERVLRLRSTTDEGARMEHDCPLDPEALALEAQAGGFWAYAAGVCYKMVVEFGVGGLEVDNYRTTLPLKKGLSSSAALCVLVARAFNRVYGLQLTTRGEMQVAYEGERLTPSQVGGGRAGERANAVGGSMRAITPTPRTTRASADAWTKRARLAPCLCCSHTTATCCMWSRRRLAGSCALCLSICVPPRTQCKSWRGCRWVLLQGPTPQAARTSSACWRGVGLRGAAAGTPAALHARASTSPSPPQAAYPHPSSDQQRALLELLGPINADITQRAVTAMAAGAPGSGCIAALRRVAHPCTHAHSHPALVATTLARRLAGAGSAHAGGSAAV